MSLLNYIHRSLPWPVKKQSERGIRHCTCSHLTNAKDSRTITASHLQNLKSYYRRGSSANWRNLPSVCGDTGDITSSSPLSGRTIFVGSKHPTRVQFSCVYVCTGEKIGEATLAQGRQLCETFRRILNILGQRVEVDELENISYWMQEWHQSIRGLCTFWGGSIYMIPNK